MIATEEREQKRQDEAENRKRRWEEVRPQADLDYAEHYRGEILMKRASQFAQTRALDEYLAALVDHIEGLDNPDEKAAAHAWLAWARQFREKQDPFATPASLPEVPHPTADALAPFMRGLSPWGPPL